MGTVIDVPGSAAGPQRQADHAHARTSMTATPFTDYESIVFHYRRNRTDGLEAHLDLLGDPALLTPMEHALHGFVVRCAHRMDILGWASVAVHPFDGDDHRHDWAPRYRLSLQAAGHHSSVTLLWDRTCSTLYDRRDTSGAFVLVGELHAGLLEDQLISVRAISHALMSLC